MGAIITILAVVSIVWIAKALSSGSGAKPRAVSIRSNFAGRAFDEAMDELFLEGVRQGFALAWTRQVSFETIRRTAHLRARYRRLAWLLSIACAGFAPFGYLAYTQLGRTDYWLNSGAALTGMFIVVSILIFMPRYKPKAIESVLDEKDLAALTLELSIAEPGSDLERINHFKDGMRAANEQQYEAGRALGRTEAEQVAHARGYKKGLNAGVQQGRAAASQEGLAELRRQQEALERAQASTNFEQGKREGYRKGLEDGRREAFSVAEAQIRTLIQKSSADAFREGYGQGRAAGLRDTGAFKDKRTKLQLPEAYQLLECEPNSTNAEIMASYKKLRKTTHPDYARGKGLPTSLLRHAESEFKRLEEAREVIAFARGSLVA